MVLRDRRLAQQPGFGVVRCSGVETIERQCEGECRKRWRADQVEGDRCPQCGGRLGAIRQFNLMFRTHLGPVADDASVAYLRPETAQGMFVDFRNVLSSSRVRVPFSIAQQLSMVTTWVTPNRS